MTANRKIERRRFLRSMAGLCVLLAWRPVAILGQAPSAGIEPRALLAALHRRVRQDFERGRTIEVGGWIVSETEAEFCRMLSQSNPGNVFWRAPGRGE